jgi:hypothetical protein
MFVIWMGGMMFMSFLPNGHFGTLLFWILMFSLVFLSHLIPHDPVDQGHDHSV